MRQGFAYGRATRLEDALAAHSAGTAWLAGGTELLNWLRLGIQQPQRVLEIGGLTALHGIRREGDDIVIGSLATLNEIGENPLVRELAPVLSQACLLAASPQIRNRATLGGNILQKTRCAYFRTDDPVPWPCNKRVPGSGCAAREGHHERLAIFGWTDVCVATQPSDPAVALACLDATIQVAGPGGTRSIAAGDFHVTPEMVRAAPGSAEEKARDEALIENRLAPTELITAFRVPVGPRARHSAYLKVRERQSYEYAMVAVAAAIELDGERVRSSRLVLGSVAQKPWRLETAERLLSGKPVAGDAARAAAGEALRAARPLAHNGFKVALAANAVARAIELAAGVKGAAT